MRTSSLLAAFVIAIAILIVPAVSTALSPSSVTLNFMCPCGSCDEALSTCECPSSDGYRSQIAGMVGSGYSEEQIIQDFKGRFGPQVLIANAAMAPDSGGWSLDRKTAGFVLLLASFTLAAFGLGKYMNPAPSRAPVRRGAKSRPEARARNSKSSGKQRSKSSGKKSRPEKGFSEGVDDELLDDYDHE